MGLAHLVGEILKRKDSEARLWVEVPHIHHVTHQLLLVRGTLQGGLCLRLSDILIIV